jgi:hypothetical protein
MTLDYATSLDIDKRYLEAVTNYEKVISTGSGVSINHYINLSFLYWEFAAEQIEFNLPNNIPEELSVIGGSRYKTVIEQALQLYPESLELRFWKKYFAFRLVGEEFAFADCLALIEEFPDDSTPVPYFFLQLFDKDAYRTQVQRLTEIGKRYPTAKNLYVLTFLSDR